MPYYASRNTYGSHRGRSIIRSSYSRGQARPRRAVRTSRYRSTFRPSTRRRTYTRSVHGRRRRR